MAVVLGAKRPRYSVASRVASGLLLGVLAVLGTSTSAVASSLTPPVIAEPFTPLPCHHGTTIGLEGCAEAQLLSADRRIDEQVEVIFRVIPTTSQKTHFVAVENEWLTYRKSDCSTVSAVFQGGTIAPIEYALCEVRDDQSRSADLHSYFSLLEEGMSGAPRWP